MKHRRIHIHVNSKLAKLILPKNYIAITLGNHIFIKALVATQDLVLHEIMHVFQYWHTNFFYLKYLWYSLKYGYEKNPFEVEARKFADDRHERYSIDGNEIFISQLLS